MRVMKFGGSSLADAKQIERVHDIVAARLDTSPFVVCSAHKGVTDALGRAAAQARDGGADASPIADRHRGILRDLGLSEALVDELIQELSDLLRGVSLVREVSPRVLDYVLGFGERMSVRVVAAYFRSRGMPAEAYDAFDLGFITDERFGAARPVADFETRVEQAMRDIPASTIPIVTGFVGKSIAGAITTVGRNGSDYTASCFAAALAADECQIWTDTDGVMTADPSLVDGAKSIPFMSFAEAAELAYYGGRVLHPATLLPAVEHRIPIRVLNTNRPERPGTVITGEGGKALNAVTSIAYKERQSVITIESPRMLMQSGFLMRVFEVLGRFEISVDMVSTSEISVSMTTSRHQRLEEVVEELEAFGRVDVTHDKSLVCIVGRELRGQVGLAAKVFGALADAEVNVEMISHGANNINLSFVVDDSTIDATVGALHAALFTALS